MPAGRLRALGRAPLMMLITSLSAAALLQPISATASAPDVTLSISAAEGIVRPGVDVPVAIAAANTSDLPTAAGTLSLRLSASALANPAAIEAWVDGDGSAVPVGVQSGALPISGGGTLASTLSVPAAALASEGAWGIEVQLTEGSTTVSARTVVSVRSLVSQADVATVFALAAPAPATGLYDEAALETLFAPGSSLESALNAIAGQTVTVGIDPRIIASIHALGSSAPARATAWLARLQLSGLDNFALQYGDADPALQAQAGYSQLLKPSFTDLPAASDAISASPEWRYSRELLWPAPNTVIGADLDMFARSGQSTVLLGSDNVSDASRPVTSSAGLTILVAQDSPSRALQRALEAQNGTDWQSATNILESELAFFGGQRILLAPNRAVITDSLRASATLTALASSSVSRAVSLGSWTPVGSVSVRDRPEPAERIASASHIASRAGEVSAFSSIALAPEALRNPLTREVLALFAVGWQSDPTGWPLAIAGFDAAVSSTLDSVRIVSSSTINVLSSEASLPFTLENSLSTPVRVRVAVSPSNGRLVVGESVDIEIAAESRETVRIPVKARIGNGSVSLTVTLTSPDGTPVARPGVIVANVQADWEGWGALALALASAALFALGIVRQVRKVRRNRTAVRDESA